MSGLHLNLDLVVELIHELGVWAYVEQTGGGCATIYAGAHRLTPHGSPGYAAVAGPGQFGWGQGPSTANTSEFFIGPDDQGETMPLDVRPLDVRCEHDVAALIAQQATLPIGVVLSQAAAAQTLDERWSTRPRWTDAARHA